MKRTWREAATLIVIARDVTKNVKFDYKVRLEQLTFGHCKSYKKSLSGSDVQENREDELYAEQHLFSWRSDRSDWWVEGLGQFPKKPQNPNRRFASETRKQAAFHLRSPWRSFGAWSIFEVDRDQRDIWRARNRFLSQPSWLTNDSLLELLSCKRLRYPRLATDDSRSQRFPLGFLR